MKKRFGIFGITVIGYLAVIHWAQSGESLKRSMHSDRPFSLRAQNLVGGLLGVGQGTSGPLPSVTQFVNGPTSVSSSASFTFTGSNWTSNWTAGQAIYGMVMWPGADNVSSVSDGTDTFNCINSTGSHSCSGMATVAGTNYHCFGFFSTSVAGGSKPTITVTMAGAENANMTSSAWEVAATNGLDAQSICGQGTSTAGSIENFTAGVAFSAGGAAVATSADSDLILFGIANTGGFGGHTVTGSRFTLDHSEQNAGAGLAWSFGHTVQADKSGFVAGSFTDSASANNTNNSITLAVKATSPGSGSCIDAFVQDFAGISSGTSLSVSNLTGTGSGFIPQFTYSFNNQGSNMASLTAAALSIINSAPTLCSGSAVYPNASTVGFEELTAAAVGTYIQVNFPTWVPNQVTAVVLFETTLSNSASFTSFDMFYINGAGNHDYVGADLVGLGANGCASGQGLAIQYESAAGGGGQNRTCISAATVYEIIVQYQGGGTHKGELVDSSGTIVGSALSTAAEATAYLPVSFYCGIAHNGPPTTGFSIYFGKWGFNYSLTQPTFPWIL